MKLLTYDALLLVSFGGPEGPEDVMPFLRNVLRGRNVPESRMLEVAEHYHHFGGVSPINQQCRELMAALEKEFDLHQINLPVYWGNRNWDPFLVDTLRQMREAGVGRALAFFTSAYSCYSGCRQYRENIAAAREAIGEGAPIIDKLRMPFNHPGFIEPQREILGGLLETLDPEERAKTPVLFTAHSIPIAMAENSRYAIQLEETGRLVAEGVGHQRWELAYQSRSGPPTQPWLEPDIGDRIEQLIDQDGIRSVVVQPIGFVSDHMEVMFDLDVEVQELCQSRGVRLLRAPTVGVHPKFISMIRELVLERTAGAERKCLGSMGPSHDQCPVDCCLYPPITSRG